tara:strand:+ start:790 stop:957 length:168 start_codon:yes stop_codon:yes gene_type:complete
VDEEMEKKVTDILDFELVKARRKNGIDNFSNIDSYSYIMKMSPEEHQNFIKRINE